MDVDLILYFLIQTDYNEKAIESIEIDGVCRET